MFRRGIHALALLPALAADAQVLMQSPELYPLPADIAILESDELRTDLSCTVKPFRPELGFDLNLHSGYFVNLPLRDLAGLGNHLVSTFRVTPEGRPDRAAYFSQRWTVPPIGESTTGAARLMGGFLVGEGSYTIDWLLRDKFERLCSARWKITAELRGRDRPIELRLAPGVVAGESIETFAEETPVPRKTDARLKVSVLLNVASQVSGAALMGNAETFAMISILRSIARDPRIGSYALTAFNLERAEVLHRSEAAPEIDFPALGKAIGNVDFATVTLDQLRAGAAPVLFLDGLLVHEVEANDPDAVILIGPRMTAAAGMRDALRDSGAPRCPIFYLNYATDPSASPWKDVIGAAVKSWKGMEFIISKPRDLAAAWNEVMGRIAGRSSPRPSAAGNLLPKK